MPAERTFPIAALLEELGFVRIASQQHARNALVEAGLTNAKKQNMAEAKSQAAIEAIDERIARVCASASCRTALEPVGRRIVEVTSEGCEVCHGSDTARATQQMAQDLVAAGRTNLLVIGGSPNARHALRDAVAGSGVDVSSSRVTVPLAQSARENSRTAQMSS
jgi:DNA-binding LacI/PurR family transcriptional regulator